MEGLRRTGRRGGNPRGRRKKEASRGRRRRSKSCKPAPPPPLVVCGPAQPWSLSASCSSVNYFKRLPPEIILKIFSYLDAASLFSVCFVSRQFHKLANDNVIWYDLYSCEMGRRKWRPRLCGPPDPEGADVQDVPAAVWKKLLFSEMGCHKDGMWMKELRYMNLNTGMPEQTEQVLRSLHVVWEITLALKRGEESVYEQSRAFFSDSAVTVCWNDGVWPRIHSIYNVQLHGVLGSSTTRTAKPPWRSLISKTLVRKKEKWKVIGQDSLVKLVQLDEGITVGVWRGTWIIAFIMATLHFHRLVERSVLGSLFCPYRPEAFPALHIKVPRGLGVHGYTVLLLLHNSVRRILQCRYSPVHCTRDKRHGEFVQLRPVHITQKYTPISEMISFPWKAGKLQGDIENCCMMTVSVLDEAQRPVWCISSSVAVFLNHSPVVCDPYDGEQLVLSYSDTEGKLKLTLVWMQDLQLYFLIRFHIWISEGKINTLLHKTVQELRDF